MYEGIHLNAVKSAVNKLAQKTLKIKTPGTGRSSFLDSITSAVAFCLMGAVYFAVIFYWASTWSTNMPAFWQLLEKMNFKGFVNALGENNLFLSFALIEIMVYVLSAITLFVIQSGYINRLFIAQKIVNSIVFVCFTAFSFAVPIAIAQIFMKGALYTNPMLFAAPCVLLYAVLLWFIFPAVLRFFSSSQVEKMPLDQAIAWDQRGHNFLPKDIYDSELRRYKNMAKAETNPAVKGTADVIVDEFENVINRRKAGESYIKKAILVILPAWCLLVTLPFSAPIFLLNSQTFDWAYNAFSIVYESFPVSDSMSYLVLAGTMMCAIHGFGTIMQILSFFLGSLVGEFRLGNGFGGVLVNSFSKTLSQSMHIVNSMAVAAFKAVVSILTIIFFEMPIMIFSKLVQKQVPFDLSFLAKLLNSFVFLIFGSLAAVKKTFLYFKLGMYPADYLSVADIDDYFETAKSAGTSMTTVLTIFIVVSLVALLMMLILAKYDQKITEGEQDNSKAILETVTNGLSLKKWIFIAYKSVVVLFVILPPMFFSFSARNNFIVDMALFDISAHGIPDGFLDEVREDNTSIPNISAVKSKKPKKVKAPVKRKNKPVKKIQNGKQRYSTVHSLHQ